ncbi:lipopolysaccharide-induced tumor necrosis factor-alpha factor homolog [Acanthaster planci]|uniref:Lipopolysaccharide-induced tumor necrosis factor-alpha factor homolog n=1 Tax=Acanthaster planci TaxID=133434 RepID=A0A8B7YJD7_ACAPL|nr:lipopolysaccharide-induced tumor necrosis factor-alpha factor homolog [Acanthaster planci]
MTDRDRSDPTEPLNPNAGEQPPSYSSTYPSPPPVGANPVYLPASPPGYSDVFQTGEKQPINAPPISQPHSVPGPAPVPGPPPLTTGNYQAGQTTIIATQTIFSAFPMMVTCPQCTQHVTTRVHYVTGLLTWLLAVLMCLFGLFLGCCLIPFCFDGCKDAIHSCPNCHCVLGTYKRI